MEGKKIVYTVPEVAKLLGINRAAAYELTHREGFPAIRITPRRIVVPADAFNRWMSAQSAGAAREGARNE